MFAVRAFNIELARVGHGGRDVESGLLQLRFQWWREALNDVYKGGDPAKHPVMLATADAIAKHRLSRYHFRKIIDAREEDVLQTGPPLSLKQLEQYCEGTACQLLLLQLGVEASRPGALEAAEVQSGAPLPDHIVGVTGALGKAIGLTILLRGTTHHAQKGKSYFPRDLCTAHEVSSRTILRGEASEGVRKVVQEVAETAGTYLQQARLYNHQLSRRQKMLLLQSLACRNYLRALRNCNYDPFHPSLQGSSGVSPLRYVLQVKWHQLLGSF